MAGGITLLTELRNRTMPDLPGCPTATIDMAIQDVVRDFCTQTECWEETITQTLTDDTVAYTLTSTKTDADIRRIFSVTIKSVASDVAADLEPVDPIYYEFNGTTGLTLATAITPTATVLTGLVTKVILVPKINATTWDTMLMNRYADAIIAGVKARLMDNDKEGWGNPRRAKDERATYDRHVALGMIERNRKYRTGSVATYGRDWL